MSNQEILEKAIQKAIEGGWKLKVWKQYNERDLAFQENNDPDEYWGWQHFTPIELIFNQDFAKSLWGDGWAYFYEGRSGDTLPSNNYINWQGHLANMVVADDPFKYLAENLVIEE